MSPKQTTYYFTLWNQVMVAQGWYHESADKKRERRLAAHVQAGCINCDGSAKSSKNLSNVDFGLIKAYFQKLITGKNHGGLEKVKEDDARRRLVWRIKADSKIGGLNTAYIKIIAKEMHVLGNWEDLPMDDLTNLRNAIHNRAGSKAGKDTRTATRRTYTLDSIPRQFVPKCIKDLEPY